MKVFVVGTGAAATTLARALRLAGVHVLGMHGRHRARTARAARIAGVPGSTGAFPAELGTADVVWIVVSDDAIAEVAQALVRSDRLRARQVVLHASGARGREVLSALSRRVAATGSLHPLQSLADPHRAAKRLCGATLAIEGSPRARLAARTLARRLGGHPVEVPARGKALYHAAAMLTSGGTVGLMGAAIAALVAAGVPRRRALSVLLPLLRGTVDNLAALGPRRALTGPVARGDVHTLALHRAAIRRSAPTLAPLYEALIVAQQQVARPTGRRRPSTGCPNRESSPRR